MRKVANQFQSDWIARKLVESENYHTFLADAFKYFRAENRNFSLASFAKRCGVSARSFPRDVALGKKRLSYESGQKFSKALGLSKDTKKLFMLLILSEQNENEFGGARTISFYRKKIRMQLENKDTSLPSQVFENKGWPVVYAALGTVERGATLLEIVERTGMSSESVLRVLTELIGLSAVKAENECYVPLNHHLLFSKFGPDSTFQSVFLETLRIASEEAKKDFGSQSKLFFSSHFSVKKDRMPELKEALRSLLLEFANSNEDPQGETVATLSSSFLST